MASDSPSELTSIADELRAMQPAWAQADRGAALTRLADELAGSADLVAALAEDTGRTVESELERRLVVTLIERWVRAAPDLLAPPEQVPAAVPGIVVGGRVDPYPLVGVIGPWNFPLLLGLIDAIPALAAGCAVLIKPSEVTQRFIGPLRQAIPADVPLRVVEGDGETGAAMIDLVDAVAFTGSVITGRRVAEAAARAFIPAFLELGGKDPAIVLAGADLDRATSAILWGGTANAGQACQSIERIYVEASVHDEFATMLAAKAGKIGLVHEGGPIGPLIDPAQVGVIERHIADAVRRGARIETGGHIESYGSRQWCRPTVLTGVDHSMMVMTDETFGPLLPIMAVPDAEAAVARANDSAYGLSAAVFAPWEAAALDVAARLEVGAISINDASLTAMVQEGAKESRKLSGLGGSRMGPAGIQRFVRRSSYLINRSSAPDPWWHGEE